MKIRKVKILNKLKREYSISNSISGHSQYTVAICSLPSCTCPDYKKNGKQVLCKHIIFVFLYVLKIEDEALLSAIWFDEADLIWDACSIMHPRMYPSNILYHQL